MVHHSFDAAWPVPQCGFLLPVAGVTGVTLVLVAEEVDAAVPSVCDLV